MPLHLAAALRVGKNFDLFVPKAQKHPPIEGYPQVGENLGNLSNEPAPEADGHGVGPRPSLKLGE
jgi:hypothetical protein